MVLVSIFSVSVFHFYSAGIDHYHKIDEKYVILRMVREFVDNFPQGEFEGQREREGYILRWLSHPIDNQRPIISKSRIASFLQLHIVHLRITRSPSEREVFSHCFLINNHETVKK